jgi:hypothetical protein
MGAIIPCARGAGLALDGAHRVCSAHSRIAWANSLSVADLAKIDDEVSKIQIQGARLPEVALKMTGR